MKKNATERDIGIEPIMLKFTNGVKRKYRPISFNETCEENNFSIAFGDYEVVTTCKINSMYNRSEGCDVIYIICQSN